MISRVFIILIAALSVLPSRAAEKVAGAEGKQVAVEARIDSLAILIGEQTALTLTVTAPTDKAVLFPELKERTFITPGVEIVEVLGDDTTALDASLRQIRRTLLLTSFDEDAYKIPALNIKVDGEDYATNPLALKVLTVEVDTLNLDQFFPPKDVQDNPFLFDEWKPLIWCVVILLLLIAIAIILGKRYKANKPLPLTFRIVRHIPAHTRALTAIQKIKDEQRVVSHDEQKAYYTALTDALRRYLEERFGFSAMEMTTGEIIAELRAVDDPKMIDELRNLFETADLVKFAKYQTLINENDRALVNAISFIDQTKTDEQEREERVAPTVSAADKQAKLSRVIMRVLLGVIAVAILVAVGIIIYNIILLV